MRMAIRCTFACLCIAAAARAVEDDIEFARRLTAAAQPAFPTDDLLEHLAGSVRAAGARETEASVIEALLYAHQSRSASLERRAELLGQAEKLCREALKAPKGSETLIAAQREYGSILRDWLRVLRAAKQLDPAAVRALSADATRAQEAIVRENEREAAALHAAFGALYQEYVKAGGFENAKPEFLSRMTAAFNRWLAAEGPYVQAASEWLDCMDEGAPLRKEAGAAMLKRFDAIEEQGAIDEFPVVTAWFRMQRGTYLALTGDTEKAASVWGEIVEDRGIELPPAQRKALSTLRRNAAYDLAKLFEKRADWTGFIGHLDVIGRDSELSTLFDEPRGFELRLEYARALTRQDRPEAGDFELALHELKRMTAQEQKRGNQPANLYRIARATADVFVAAQKQCLKPRVDAEQLLQAGFGLFAGAEQKTFRRSELKENDPRRAELKAAADAEYHDASRLYLQSLRALKDGKADALRRLRMEAKARHELTLCFYRQGLRYETVIAAWALLDDFAPDFVEREVARLTEPKRRDGEKALSKAWSAAEPFFEKTYRLQELARAEVRRANAKPDDLWNKEFASGGLNLRRSPWDLKLATEDPAYAAGSGFFELGRRFASEARAARVNGEQKEAARKAQEMLQRADGEYGRVAADSKYTLPALCQRAFVRIQDFELQQFMKAPDAVATAERTLAAITEYESAAEANDSPLWTAERRTSAAGVLLLARAGLEMGCKRFENALTAADGYLVWVQKNSIQNGAVAQAQLLKFRALAGLLDGGFNAGTLTEAENTFDALTGSSDNTRALAWMCDTLLRVHHKRLENPEESRAVYTDLARWQKRKLELLAQDGSAAAQFAEHTRWLSFLEKSGQTQATLEAAAFILKRFDAENRNAQTDDSAWPALLTRMVGGEGQRGAIDYADLNQRDRCRQEHRILIDLLYDTPHAAAPENDPQRPAHDLLNSNLERAAAQADKIRKSFPGSQTLDPRYGDNGVSLLQQVADEIDFRRRVLAVRRLLLKQALEAAARGTPKAERARALAAEQLKILMEAEGETPALKLQLASLYTQTGKLEEAQALLLNLRSVLLDNSPEYFDTLKLQSRVHAQQGRWADAAEYPLFILQTAGAESRLVRERWPDVKEFLERCFANGVKRPAER